MFEKQPKPGASWGDLIYFEHHLANFFLIQSQKATQSEQYFVILIISFMYPDLWLSAQNIICRSRFSFCAKH